MKKKRRFLPPPLHRHTYPRWLAAFVVKKKERGSPPAVIAVAATSSFSPPYYHFYLPSKCHHAWEIL